MQLPTHRRTKQSSPTLNTESSVVCQHVTASWEWKATTTSLIGFDAVIRKKQTRCDAAIRSVSANLDGRARWIELYIYAIATDNNAMFQASLRILMIATVLGCPALCGRCCDAGRTDVTAESPAVGACESCCCHDSQSPEPACPSEGGECHDCFCAGALPIGPSILDSLSFHEVSFDFVVLTSASKLSSSHRTSTRLDVCQWPPTTGERLATLCTLLI